jgi:hypothetical protein
MDIWTKFKKMYPLMYECALVALALPTIYIIKTLSYDDLPCTIL